MPTSSKRRDEFLRHIIASWLVAAEKCGYEAKRKRRSATTLALRALWHVRDRIPENLPSDAPEAAIGWVPELACLWIRRGPWQEFVTTAELPNDQKKDLSELYDLLYDGDAFESNHRKMYAADWFKECLNEPAPFGKIVSSLDRYAREEFGIPSSLPFPAGRIVFTGNEDRVTWVGCRNLTNPLEELYGERETRSTRAALLQAPMEPFSTARFPDDGPAHRVCPVLSTVERDVQGHFASAVTALWREFRATTGSDQLTLLPAHCAPGVPAALACAADASIESVRDVIMRASAPMRRLRMRTLVLAVPARYDKVLELLQSPQVRAAASALRLVYILDFDRVVSYVSHRVWLWSELDASGAFRIVRWRGALGEALRLDPSFSARLSDGAVLPVHPSVLAAQRWLTTRATARPFGLPFEVLRVEGLAQSGKTTSLYQLLADRIETHIVFVLRPVMSAEEFSLLTQLLLWLRAEYGLPIAFGIDDYDRAVVHREKPSLERLCLWLDEHPGVGDIVVVTHGIQARSAVVEYAPLRRANLVSLFADHDFSLAALSWWMGDERRARSAHEELISIEVTLGSAPLGAILKEGRRRLEGNLRVPSEGVIGCSTGADLTLSLDSFMVWRADATDEDLLLFWLLGVLWRNGFAHVPLSLLEACCLSLGSGWVPVRVDRLLGRLALAGWIEWEQVLVFVSEASESVYSSAEARKILQSSSHALCDWLLSHRDQPHWELLQYVVALEEDRARRTQQTRFIEMIDGHQWTFARSEGLTGVLALLTLACCRPGAEPSNLSDHIIIHTCVPGARSVPLMVGVAKWREQFRGIPRMSWMFAAPHSPFVEPTFVDENGVEVLAYPTATDEPLEALLSPDERAGIAALPAEDQKLLLDLLSWVALAHNMPRHHRGILALRDAIAAESLWCDRC